MESFDQEDIGLLFKSVVILPQDSSKKEQKSGVEKKIDEAESYNDKSSKSEVSEPLKTLSTPNQSCVILTTLELKENFMSNGSSFQKIIEALGISPAKKYLTTDLSLEKLKDYKCVWCLGLPHDMEAKILKIKHPNLLLSPSILDLKTKEEKMAMYSPLKEFVSKNITLFSSVS